MEDTTKMLANMILIALENQERWVSEPRFETLSIIEDIRTYNKIITKQVDEDGDVTERFDGYRNQELEDKLKLIEATSKKDESDYKRYNSEKIKAMTRNLEMIKSIVKMYGAQSEE
ncbi:hypothetical protein [Streptococcus pseudopneumoniae]|jgi:hypothetical protein|uniref:hypothetical protein n=1 Tax=Streptococcus pseudopneumoniae TaxID=257758 RepID=UPI00066E6F58|nr:hypothetical protein [Streptococcus pseudopneumoniae]